jgi:hypothetical protein
MEFMGDWLKLRPGLHLRKSGRILKSRFMY